MHALCQMTFYHSEGRADHGRRRRIAGAFDRDTAAQMLNRQPGSMLAGSGMAWPRPMFRHALPQLQHQHAFQQRLGIGVAGFRTASVSLRSTKRPRYITATSLATCSTTARLWLMKR